MHSQPDPTISWCDGMIVIGTRQSFPSIDSKRECPGCGFAVVARQEYPDEVAVVCESCVDTIVGCP
jgi:hypothetical protein